MENSSIARNLLILLGGAAATAPAVGQTAQKPNIIYIKCDGMGIGNTVRYGNRRKEYIAKDRRCQY